MKKYIFDIDNTLCNTWPTLKKTRGFWLNRFFKESWRVSFIPCFDNMIICAATRKSRISSEIYFLSARHWSLWPVTYIYLIRHLGYFSPQRLILVSSALDKIEKFEYFQSINKNPIVVVDDLSYNTENGKTLFHLNVIQYLKSRHDRIRYIDKEKIDRINKTMA